MVWIESVSVGLVGEWQYTPPILVSALVWKIVYTGLPGYSRLLIGQSTVSEPRGHFGIQKFYPPSVPGREDVFVIQPVDALTTFCFVVRSLYYSPATPWGVRLYYWEAG